MNPAAGLPEIALPAGTRVIADLHLDPCRSEPWRAFEAWLTTLAGVPALLVLGDFFEFWVGPGQARDPAYAALLAGLRARACAGTALHFLCGNRDFLLESAFERAVGGCVHPGGLIGRTASGARVLFLHGDELATRDRSYQRIRRVLRSRAVRALSSATPTGLASAAARAMRRQSARHVAAKSAAYLELQSAAAAAWCTASGASHLVCGHAHRYRCETLERGARWVVLDAFGGARDLLRVTAEGELVSEGSGASGLRH